MWRGHAFSDCTAEFRLCWLHAKMAEEGERYATGVVNVTPDEAMVCEQPAPEPTVSLNPAGEAMNPVLGASSEDSEMLPEGAGSGPGATLRGSGNPGAAPLTCPDFLPGTPFFRLRDAQSGAQFRCEGPELKSVGRPVGRAVQV